MILKHRQGLLFTLYELQEFLGLLLAELPSCPGTCGQNSLKFGRDRLCALKSPLVLAIPGKSQPERKALSVRNQGSWAIGGKGARNSSRFTNKIITRNEKFSFLTAA